MNAFDPGAAPTSISTREAEGLLRLLEAAPGVRRRYQYFVWLQTQVHPLLPHTVAICGSWRRQLRDLAWEVFHGVVLDDTVLAQLSATGSPLMRQVTRRWLEQGDVPMATTLAMLHAEAAPDERPGWKSLADQGLGHALVHGVCRPERTGEVETLFLFVAPGDSTAPSRPYFLDLLVPHLHAVYQRVQVTERELGLLPARARHPVGNEAVRDWHLTARERQILQGVREGRSNQQIGELLEISPLTVKNHVQKILRKMGAANRAQAVSLAIGANLLKDATPGSRPRDG